MQLTDYHKNIIEYYDTTENAYKDSWDLEIVLPFIMVTGMRSTNSFPGIFTTNE